MCGSPTTEKKEKRERQAEINRVKLCLGVWPLTEAHTFGFSKPKRNRFDHNSDKITTGNKC